MDSQPPEPPKPDPDKAAVDLTFVTGPMPDDPPYVWQGISTVNVSAGPRMVVSHPGDQEDEGAGDKGPPA